MVPLGDEALRAYEHTTLPRFSETTKMLGYGAKDLLPTDIPA